MKLKVTVVFILLAGLFLYLVFKGGYMATSSKAVTTAVQSGLTGSGLIEALSKMDLRDYKGNKLTINKGELEGAQKVVIHLWASWCAPCVNEVPELVEYSVHNPDVKFIIVSLDDYYEDIEKFMKSFPKFNDEKFVRIWDSNKSISALLKTDRLPMSVLINKNKAEPKFILAAVNWKNIDF
jgi:thiol-disulfide isomerase/thioredoxin